MAKDKTMRDVTMDRLAATGIDDALPDWETEDRYWRAHYASRPYVMLDYDSYRPAYRYGVFIYSRFEGRPYHDIDESELRRGWENLKDKATLTWERAKDAVRDAYERLFNREKDKRKSA